VVTVNPDIIEQETLIKNAPHQIYDINKSNVPLDLKAFHVVATRGSKKAYIRSINKRGW